MTHLWYFAHAAYFPYLHGYQASVPSPSHCHCEVAHAVLASVSPSLVGSAFPFLDSEASFPVVPSWVGRSLMAPTFVCSLKRGRITALFNAGHLLTLTHTQATKKT